MRIASLIFALIGLGLMAAPAQAGQVCNQTSYVVEVASGWPVESGVAIEGWERIRPGECENLATEVDLDGEQPIFYYAKTSEAYLGGVREWRGNVPLCVDETDFEVVASTRCAALGLASRDFMLREGDQRDRTVFVEPTDYTILASPTARRRSGVAYADIAGIQRLLQSAGYAITSVDGYEGSGTRRAISSFQSDAGLSTRPSNGDLIDALESAALARNATSGVTLCNDSIGDISAVIGHRVGDAWQSRGWWRLHAGECARVLADHLDTANAYYYAERINTGERSPMTGGDQAFCVAPARFVAEGRDNCTERGYSRAMFRVIPEPEDGGVRINVTDTDFPPRGRTTP